MISPEDPRHGTNAGHVAGCREDCCRIAKLRYDKQRRYERDSTGQARLVPAVGFRRRVRALQALGWSFARIAPHLGVGVGTLSNKMAQGDMVNRRTHERMVEVYDRLSMVTPTGAKVDRDRRQAAAKGWAPPLAWAEGSIDDPDAKPYRARTRVRRPESDPVLIQRALDGQRVDANSREKDEITRRWRATGRSLNELELLQGWNARRIVRRSA